MLASVNLYSAVLPEIFFRHVEGIVHVSSVAAAQCSGSQPGPFAVEIVLKLLCCTATLEMAKRVGC